MGIVESVEGDFNPHSRTGSDERNRRRSGKGVISIHTPARGVTYFLRPHAAFVLDFNPHSRTGSDDSPLMRAVFQGQISIHTPARGVTHKV